jgi:mRNA-degrading endonuclease RelE of RelBE toxin-antitoxin system
MRFILTSRFKKAYQSLTAGDQGRVQKAIRLMSGDLRHPGLRVKRIKGTQGIWEARASKSLRITFETEGDALILRNVGHHDQTL